MEQSENENQEPQVGAVNKKKVTKKSTSTTTPMRVKKTTQSSIKKLLTKINRKSYGKKVKVDDLLEKLLSLFDESIHIKELQDASLSNADRLDINYKEYCKKHGNVSKDEYLGILLMESQDSPPSIDESIS